MEITPPQSEEPESLASQKALLPGQECTEPARQSQDLNQRAPEKTLETSAQNETSSARHNLALGQLLSRVDDLAADPLVQQLLQRLQEKQLPHPTPLTANAHNEEDQCPVKVKIEKNEALPGPSAAVPLKATVCVKAEQAMSLDSLAMNFGLAKDPMETSAGGKADPSDSQDQNEVVSSENEADAASQSSYANSDGGEGSDLDWSKSTRKFKKATAKRTKRLPPPKTPREWMARRREAEASKKRKREEETETSQKAQKTGKDLLKKLSDPNDNTLNDAVPTMPEIRAKTHKAQSALLRKMIPDTRHSQDQKRELEDARKVFGYKRVEAIDGKYKLKGMKSALDPYQQVASGWMLQRELDEAPPYGGIVADAPGFGKTVISLNTIMGHPPSPEDIEEFSGATLIVVPNREVASQWFSEIQKHCLFDKNRHSTVYAKVTQWPAESYRTFWIVIATYRDLCVQFLSKKRILELKEETLGDEAAFEEAKNAELGVLFQVDWYRVILDEAHQIKNHHSQAARASWEFRSKYRWALTATPLSNDATEFYPYLKFLGCEPASDRKSFTSTYCPDGTTDAKFDALIGKIMLRRTLKDEFLGHRILPLEPIDTHDVWVSLSEAERAIFDVVDVHYEEKIAKREAENDGKEGDNEETRHGFEPDENAEEDDYEEDEEKRTSRYLLLRARFQRLRQAVSHPFNLERCFRGVVCQEAIQELKSALAEIKPMPMAEWLRNGDEFLEGLFKYEKGLRAMEAIDYPEFGGSIDIQELLTMVNNEKKVKGLKCLICLDGNFHWEPMQAQNCEHVYCVICLTNIASTKKRASVMKCLHPECPEKLEVGKRLDILGHTQNAARKERYKEPGRDSAGARLLNKPETNGFYLAAARRDTCVTMPPSAKLTAAMAVILTWVAEAPNDKIIVFSEYIMTAKILGYMLEKARIGFVYFNGAITAGQKSTALRKFKEDCKTKVFLASMCCGGQSLNLTEANRVIILDLWWNKTREQQAFGRVLRRGQEKKTYLVRILTRGGIDERIAELQETKSEVVDRALQDDGHDLKELPQDELEQLFASKENREPFNRRKARGRASKAPSS